MTSRIEEIVERHESRNNKYIAIVLDRSGSMSSVVNETISGFNEQIQALKDVEEEANVFITFVTFASYTQLEFAHKRPSEISELTRSDYIPRGTTAMYDGVGIAIETLRDVYEENQQDESANDSYLVIVMSDGHENNSSKWKRNDLAEQIQELESSGKWTFTYIGANQDLSKVAEDLNIQIGNMRSYSATCDGTATAFSAMARATVNYMSSGSTFTNQFYSSLDDNSEE